jgi:hypothetical protein
MKLLLGIIAVGILSRVVHTGFAVFDKYLGDALYAAMVYVILRLAAVPKPWLFASLTMFGLELFQLTGIPAQMAASDLLPLRMLGVMLGTRFSALDLLAYAVGILSAARVPARSNFPARPR